MDNFYISSLFTWTWHTTHETVELCREIHPKATIHLGGIYPTLCPEQAKASGADIVHCGTMKELNSVWPDLALSGRGSFEASILKTSIGCPNRCSYCAVNLLEGRQMQYRDPDDVAMEVRHAHEKFGVRSFHFWESNLLLDPERHFYPLMERLSALKLPLELMAPEGVQVNLVNRRTAGLMHKAGFRNVFLTVETTDRKWATIKRRPTGFQELPNAILELKKAGFRNEQLYCVLLIGQPGQERTSILKDIVSIYSLGCPVSLLVYTPIPGTEDYFKLDAAQKNLPLEDLDPLLFPMASKALKASDMERMIEYFNFRHYPLERILASHTNDGIICEMKDLIATIPA